MQTEPPPAVRWTARLHRRFGFSPPTVEYLHRAGRAKQKRLGQYFTPERLRRALISKLQLAPGMRVLDPGVGTGELLRTCAEACPGLELHGFDIDGDALAAARAVVPGAILTKRDALAPHDGDLYDVIIGNPPYYEIRRSPELRKRFAHVIHGRPNIFSMFFVAGLSMLKPGGRLAFVAPPSMNNGAYFEKLRRYIVAHCEVEYLEILKNAELFAGAQQTVQIIILHKGGAGKNYQFSRTFPDVETGDPTSRVLFTTSAELLNQQFMNCRSMYELGYRATTGPVVWNQKKAWLRAEPGPDCYPLIWAHNLTDGTLQFFEGHARPQYVHHPRPLEGPAIVVNRVTGAVGGGALRAAMVPSGFRFLAENHVNVITPRDGVDVQVGMEELLNLLKSPTLFERVRALTGNTQISATELTHLLPLG